MTRTQSHWITIFVALVLGVAGCADAPVSEDSALEVDLGALSAKADGVTLREVELKLAPGAIKRFRIKTVGFRAELQQRGEVPTKLSVKSFEIDHHGQSDVAPTVQTPIDGAVRTWTLRVHNEGSKTLIAKLNVLEWDPSMDDAPYVGTIGAELRRQEVSISAGSTQRFRIATTRFHAVLNQDSNDPVSARLSAKHYEIDIYGDAALNPQVDAIADVDAMRNWTLRITNLGDAVLNGEVVVHELLSEPTVEIAVISDIDKTVMPPELANDVLAAPYPGITSLLTALERGDDGAGQAGDIYYVTARSEERAAEIPAWMAVNHVPAGPISTGISGMPWIAQAEKVRDISAIIEANPQQRFVLFGDSSHRDPEAYTEIVEKYPGRIVAAFIHKVNNPNPNRVALLTLVDNYAQAAAQLFGVGLFDELAARRVIAAAQAEGLDISQAEVDGLLDAQRAKNAQP